MKRSDLPKFINIWQNYILDWGTKILRLLKPDLLSFHDQAGIQADDVRVCVLSCVLLLATPQTAAYQAPLSMGFSRQEYWSGPSNDVVSLTKFTLDPKTGGRIRKGFARERREWENKTVPFSSNLTVTETKNIGKIITYLPTSQIARASWKLKKLKNTAPLWVPGHRKPTAYYVRTWTSSK